MCNLNPYGITWGIIILNNDLTKKAIKSINKEMPSVIGKRVIQFHSGNRNKASERAERIITALKANNRSGSLWFFTDKQFGLTQNSWDGAPRTNAIMSHHITYTDGYCYSTIPLTKNQAKARLSF